MDPGRARAGTWGWRRQSSSPAIQRPRSARFAGEFGCDVIVMGTHGRTGLRRAAIGLVAEGVIRAARCPVLVVRRPDEG